MDLLPVVHVLRRRRWVLAAGAACAALLAILPSYRVALLPPTLQAREGGSGAAVAEVFVDTSHALAAELRAPGDDTIAPRAALLGELIESDAARAAIARRTGVRAEELTLRGPGSQQPAAVSPLSEAAAAATEPRRRYGVSVSAGPEVPIVTIEAVAPGPARAAELAEAAAATMRALARVPRTAPAADRVRVAPLGEPRVRSVDAGGGPAAVALLALGLAGLWSLVVVLGDSAARRLGDRGPSRVVGRHA